MSDKQPRTVLVGMDGSKHSDHALDWYLKKLRRPGDKVLLTYCAEHVGSYPPLTSLDDELVDIKTAHEDQMKQTIQKIEGLAKNNKFAEGVKKLSGHPGQSLVKAANDQKADFIVIGSRGRGIIRRTIMGSVSDYILHHSIVPVVVCKHEDEHYKLAPEPDESVSCFT